MTELPKITVHDPEQQEGREDATPRALSESELQRLRARPGATTLLEVFAEQPGVYLVGGAVRDLLLGSPLYDLDVMVEGDAAAAAERLADAVPGRVTMHERFLTANFTADEGELAVDFATARREHYSRPGALPEVEPSDLLHDLDRRDFTINAMAVALWRERLGELHEYPGARSDLRNGLLRITHDLSFRDDPTRLLRLLRYGARLGFSAEPRTEAIARNAVASGVVAEVSGPRVRNELFRTFSERAAVVAVEALGELGLDSALFAGFTADEYSVARALNQRVGGLRQDLVVLALCSREMDQARLAEWLEHLQLSRGEARKVTQMVSEGPGLIDRAAASDDLPALLAGHEPETALFALALTPHDPETSSAVRGWLRQRTVAAKGGEGV